MYVIMSEINSPASLRHASTFEMHHKNLPLEEVELPVPKDFLLVSHSSKRLPTDAYN